MNQPVGSTLRRQPHVMSLVIDLRLRTGQSAFDRAASLEQPAMEHVINNLVGFWPDIWMSASDIHQLIRSTL